MRFPRAILLGTSRTDMSRIRLLLVLLGGVALLGCAARPIPIDPALRTKLQGEARIDAFVAPPHVFDITSAWFVPVGGAFGAWRGPFFAVHGGEGGLHDPALAVRERFLVALRGAGFEGVVARTDRFAGETAASRGDDAPYAFVFETERWSLSSDVVSEYRHRLRYEVLARVERAADGEILWRARARTGAEAGTPVRPLEEFFARDMAILRQDLELVARECADALAVHFLEGTSPRSP